MCGASRGGFRVGTLNVDTLKLRHATHWALRKSFRISQIVLMMNYYNISVVALQETRLTFNGGQDILRHCVHIAGENIHIYLMSASKGYNGMAFLSKMPLTVEKVSDRIISGSLKIGKLQTCIFNIYSPTAASDKDKQDEFNANLFDSWQKSNHGLKIICGDFNSPLQKPFRGTEHTDRTKSFKLFLSTLEARSAHMCCWPKRQWTYTFPNGAKKQLDHIVVNTRFASSMGENRVLLPPIPTPHCLNWVGFRIKWKRASLPTPPRPYWGSLRDEKTQDVFIKSIKEVLHAPQKRQRDGNMTVSIWKRMESAIKTSSKSLPKMCKNLTLNEEQKRDISKVRPEEYSDNENDLEKVVKLSRNRNLFEKASIEHTAQIEEVIETECANPADDLRKRSGAAFRKIRKIIGDNRAKIGFFGNNERQCLEKIYDHFSKIGHSSTEEDEVVKFIDALKPTVPINDDPFTIEELYGALSNMHNGKAAGSDDIPVEAYKALSKDAELSTTLLNIINEIQETGITDDTWRTVLQVPVPKKGNTNDLLQWRPICLVNHIVKVMNRMALERIQPALEEMLRPNQFGFRPNHSTSGAQAIFQEITQKASRGSGGVAVGFVDFKQAFPSVSHSAIRAALSAFHIPENLKKLILALYCDLKSFVRTPYGDTESFRVRNGTLQGDVLAPTIFVMVLDRILCAAIDNKQFGLITQSRGTRSRGKERIRVSDTNYADDIALFAESKQELSKMIESLVSCAGKANLRVSVGPSKTAWMTFGRVPDSNGPLIVTSIGEIPRVKQYRYLGNVYEEGKRGKPALERVRAAWYAMNKLQGIWNSPLPISSKLIVFKTLVMPVLVYSAGTWTLTDKETKHLDTQVHRMRRWVCGVSSWDGKKGTRLYSLYQGDDRVSTTSRIKRAQLVGHLVRHSCLYTHASMWRHNEESKFPTTIEQCARDLNLLVSEVFVQAQDRSHWSSLIGQLRKRLEPNHGVTTFGSTKWMNEYKRTSKDTTYENLQFLEEGPNVFPLNRNEVHLYTDGCLIRKQGKMQCGCGILALGHQLPTTNLGLRLPEEIERTSSNSEMYALCEGLDQASGLTRTVVIHTDSAYVWDFVHKLRHQFRLTGYQNAENPSLLRVIDAKLRKIEETNSIYVVKVKAHCGNQYNEMADWLAKQAAERQDVSLSSFCFRQNIPKSKNNKIARKRNPTQEVSNMSKSKVGRANSQRCTLVLRNPRRGGSMKRISNKQI